MSRRRDPAGRRDPAKRRAVTLGIVALLAILVVAGALAVWLAQRPSLPPRVTPLPTVPPLTFTPPPSLDDLAQVYPDLADLLGDAKLNSVYKEFLVAYEQGGLEAAEDLARQRGLLNARDELRMILVLDTEDPEPLVAQLEAAGIGVEDAYRDMVAVAVPLPEILALSEGDPSGLFRQLTELSHVVEIRLPESPVRNAAPVEGEGVNIIGADAWHRAGYSGSGVKVAVLDGAFEGYEALLGSELPTDVAVQSFGYEEGMSELERRHGTACAEIVHEVAPGADLYLVTFEGDIGFGRAVDWLIAQDVDVVSLSGGWLAGPRDSTSRQAKRVDEARAAGILWVNSAGNHAQAHYAGRFTDTDGNGLHDFGPGQEVLGFYPETEGMTDFVLYWDDWPRSNQDLDLYLMDGEGQVLASSLNIQDGGQEPVERLTFPCSDAERYYLTIQAVGAIRTPNLDLFVSSGFLGQPVTAGSLLTPADARGALSVGATDWRDDGLERFSSCGPTFDGRSKPELTAPDGIAAVSYRRFGGTSAAAPHAAGAAALVLSAFPEASPGEVVAYLQGNAVDLGPPGVDNCFGAGRLALGPPPEAEPPPSATATDEPVTPPTATRTQPPSATAPPEGGPGEVTPTTGPTPSPTATPPSPAAPVRDRSSLRCLVAVGLGLAIVLLVVLAIWLLTGWPARQPAPLPPPQPSPETVCRRCGAQQRPGARFCGRCGATVGAPAPMPHCPFCGQQIYSSGAKHCGHCGRRLGSRHPV